MVAKTSSTKRESTYRGSSSCFCLTVYSTRHFILARKELDIAQCADLISMQTILCLITFLVATSRLTSAYTYLGIACTSALRLGLHKEMSKETPLSETQQESRLRIMLAVLQLDTFVSIVLNMPARVNPDCLDAGVLAALQPPATKKPSNSDNSTEARAKFAAATKHLHILSLTNEGLRGIFVQGSQKERSSNGPDIDSVDTKKMAETEDAFRRWAKALSYVPLVGQNSQLSAV